MQESPASIPHWLQLTLTSLASALSAIGIDRLYNIWLNRKKPAAEIHLTHASTTETIVRSYAAAGDSMGRMMDRLDAAQVTIDGVREDNDKLKLRLSLMELAEQSLMDQLNSAHAYIKFLGKHPTDVDRFRVELKSREKPSETTPNVCE
jgi:hypothetical protein